MTNLEVAKFVFDQHNFRIGKLYWLAACNDGESLPEALAEAIENGDLYTMEGLPFDPHEGIRTDELGAADELLSNRLCGFLARVETPVPLAAHRSGDTYTTAGWGQYKLRWIYAESLDEMLALAAKVSDAFIQAELTRLRAEQNQAEEPTR